MHEFTKINIAKIFKTQFLYTVRKKPTKTQLNKRSVLISICVVTRFILPSYMLEVFPYKLINLQKVMTDSESSKNLY